MSDWHHDLKPPPALAAGTLRIVPLGGLGEIGRNMAVFELGGSGKLLIVDCGVLFPKDLFPGVDLVLPDFGYIADRLDEVVGLVLTHGHEDHVGAVPYLLRLRPDIPLFGSKLTLGLVRAKMQEHDIKPVLEEVGDGQIVSVGPYECEFVAVNHSIPDALAVAIRTSAGTVLHTGDFKMDQLPLDHRLTDLRTLAKLGERGIDLLMIDSTNAEVPGFTVSEREITPVIDRVFAQADKRIVVAAVSTHVHRVQQVLNAAETHGRHVAFVGRSMVRNMAVAADLGYLRVPHGVIVDLKHIDDLPDNRVVLLCTGSQGEPLAALSRIANRDHRQISLNPGDTVVLAASLIPGNENAVFRVINGLTRLGARVVHQGNARVHVSGHASAGELLYVYNIVQPGNVMPVHGEPRHLAANAALAASTGVPRDHVIVAEDGVVVDLVGGRATVVGEVPVGYVYVDGSSVGEITEAELKSRRILGDEGFISVAVVIDSSTGKVISGPHFHAFGFAEHEAVFEDVRPRIVTAITEAAAGGTVDDYEFQQIIRRIVGKWVSQSFRRRPMIVPLVLQT